MASWLAFHLCGPWFESRLEPEPHLWNGFHYVPQAYLVLGKKKENLIEYKG